ncbi:MAG TPA: hydrogenase [Campylobacterales bacterium]|jgi:membrane-bound hydrogenase subunit mbhJ|nr:hydrogenase [Campylobacterales bacterium]HHC11171.1 hydrogenase [Campylobacterales bacterium]
MIKFWKKRVKSSILTEHLEYDKELTDIQKELKSLISKKFASSLSIRMVDSGSCNACESECNALSNPYYNLDRLGISFVASPRHADVLLVSGVNTFNMHPHLLDAYAQMPSPKYLITLGDCPIMSDNVFDESFAIVGDVAKHLSVDYHIAGCPPTPNDIIFGLLEFLRGLDI